MEMTFLQHATGMASEALPTSVMRSLSGADTSFLAKSLSSRLKSEVTDEHKPLYEETATSVEEYEPSYRLPPEGMISPPDSAASSFASTFVQDNLLYPNEVVETIIVDQVIREHVTSGDKLSSEDLVKVLNMTSDSSDENIVKTRARLNSNSAEEVKNAAFSMEIQQALRISEMLGGEKFDITDTSDIPRSTSSSKLSSPLSKLMKPSDKIESPIVRSKVSSAEIDLYSFGASNSPTWPSIALSLTDELLGFILPNKESIAQRHLVFNYLRSTVSASLGMQLFPVGSFVSNTFLPDSNINTSAFVVKREDDVWFVRLNEALCMSIFSDNNFRSDSTTTKSANISISNVSFVNQDKKMIKSLINNLSVDVSMNQIGALYNESFIEEVNAFIGQDNLFKKSIILVKAWSRYEVGRRLT